VSDTQRLLGEKETNRWRMLIDIPLWTMMRDYDPQELISNVSQTSEIGLTRSRRNRTLWVREERHLGRGKELVSLPDTGVESRTCTYSTR
jgi:hypothetical protein